MNKLDKYWRAVKKKSPTILALLGSAGVGATAYLAARNEAKYQHARFDYYIEHGYFPEDYNGTDLSKDELRKKAYGILGNHLKHHITTFISGGVTVTSILGGNALGNKQNAALLAMNVGVGNMIAKRREAEDKAIETKTEDKKGFVSKEDIQDYLVREAYDDELVYYTTIKQPGQDDEFIWLETYPGNKIFIVSHNDVVNLQWFINKSICEQNYISYGEIFDYLNIYSHITPTFVDEDINDWIYLYGFSKEEDSELKIEVYSRQVEVEEGVFVTALSFSSVGSPIQNM